MTDIQDPKPSNFLRQIIERDIERHIERDKAAGPQAFPIRLRFPPEPNGYLHVGHAKSICLNFGLSKDYGGLCHLRFDDTNPEQENEEYVRSIIDAVRWLGFDWHDPKTGIEHLYYASDYFEFMYEAAQWLIEAGLAYVDEQNADQIRLSRGTLIEPGTASAWRERPIEENLQLFKKMRAGAFPDGAMVLRAKIDMASPNLNLRDPVIYRIKHAYHHRTGDAWCIYPMYTYAHPIEDALEKITHSICTLEFADQRPFYDWLLHALSQDRPGCKPALFKPPLPHQYEFSRLNLTHVMTSKRKLKRLVDEGWVDGWDDPRLPTIAGLRRRGFTPEAIHLFCERIGVSKADSWIEFSTLEQALRDDLEPKVPRVMAVLDPLPLTLTNWDEIFGDATVREVCHAPSSMHESQDVHHEPRTFLLGPEVWIDRQDFEEIPPKGYRRLYPGHLVRLKYAYVIECTGCEKDAHGHVTRVLARLIPDTKSGTPGADQIKVKGVITWVSTDTAMKAEVRIYDSLLVEAQPDVSAGEDFLDQLSTHSKTVTYAYLEPTIDKACPDDKFQFERHGYFVADLRDHGPMGFVFNKITGLKDSWGKQSKTHLP